MSREDNKHFIKSLLDSSNNEIMILYGSRYVGIRSFVFETVKNKEFFYYHAIPCNLKLQMEMIVSDLSEKVSFSSKNIQDLALLIKEYVQTSDSKKVIVIEEFQHIYKENITLFNYLISIIREYCPKGSINIVLTCESEDYITNDFLPGNPPSLYELSGVFNISKMSPVDVRKKYKKLSFNEMIFYYSILGGNSNLWNMIDISQLSTIKDFIPSVIIAENGILHGEMSRLLPEELRETSVYNTILYYLASGNTKLNDLYTLTGYSRAKISVYLKNLINLGLVSKAAESTIGPEIVHKKGIYYIADSFVKFYYSLIFRNLSKISLMAPEKFTKKYIDTNISILREDVYREYILHYLEEYLPSCKAEYFYDKNDSIDIAVEASDGRIIFCSCQFSSPHMSYSRLESMLNTCQEYNLKYTEILLFSAVDFDQKLRLYSSMHNEVKLINLNH